MNLVYNHGKSHYLNNFLSSVVKKVIAAVSEFLPIVFLLITLFCPVAVHAATARVAIVIDDIGYRYTDKQVLTLPGAITFSILPHTPYGKILALKANKNHKDVLLHIPMEAENGKKLGPGALTSAMNEAEIHASLNESLAEIPFAIGINNHMGSRLTQLSNPMLWTMGFLKQRKLLFLDSRTSSNTKASNIAKTLGVPVQERHLFLDNQLTDKYIKQQFQLLIQYAQKQNFAIAIAHPHPETIQALTRLIPTLKHNNIDLVPLSALYPPQKAVQTLVVINSD